MRRLLILAGFGVAFATLTLGSSGVGADGPTNAWERLRFPWPADTSFNVTQSVNSSPTHTSANAYAIDWPLTYGALGGTFVAATAQGQVVQQSTLYSSKVGYGAYVVQAFTTAPPAELTRYVLYAHLCYVAPALYDSLNAECTSTS